MTISFDALGERAFWDRFQETAKPTAKGVSAEARFGWTQYPDHGPGEEVLGTAQRVLELGCGIGNEVAYLDRLGLDVIGVDFSGVGLERARAKWPAQADRFQQYGALDYLARTEGTFDAVYSIFGAMWFNDPEEILPLALRRLRPGGVLAFSHLPPVPGCHGVAGAWQFGGRGEPMCVRRWNYEPEMWVEILDAHGFVSPTADVLEAPTPGDVGTLLVRAVA